MNEGNARGSVKEGAVMRELRTLVACEVMVRECGVAAMPL